MRVTGGDAIGPAPAHRVGSSRWRQPRLLLGVALVLGSALAGGWVLATARDTTDYWSLRADVRAGEVLEADDLTVVAARVDAAAAAALLPVGDGVPAGVWSRDVAAGTILTRDAVAGGTDRGRQLPIAVQAGALPADLAAGDVVDVWAGPADASDDAVPARRMLVSVPVVAVSRGDGTGSRTVLLDTGRGGPDASVVATAASRRLTVVRVP